MGVTTLLLPVPESEAEALIEGGPEANHTIGVILERARRWRRRTAWVDLARDDLHDLLFPRWADATRREPGRIERMLALFRPREPAAPSTGYDPFIHLHGRSLPIDAATSAEIASLLVSIEKLDDAAFRSTLLRNMERLDPRAPTLVEQHPMPPIDDALWPRLSAEARKVREVVSATGSLQPALDALARVFAWSQPIWRFDGDTLDDVLAGLGIEVVPGRAESLFEIASETNPSLTERLTSLPKALPAFAGAGAFLSSSDTKLVASALRMRRGQVAKNAGESDEPELLMRHARLLEEATLYCESQGFGLLEAAGVEWNER